MVPPRAVNAVVGAVSHQLAVPNRVFRVVFCDSGGIVLLLKAKD